MRLADTEGQDCQMALKSHCRVLLEVKGRSLMYSSGDSAKDKCAAKREGNVSGRVRHVEPRAKGTQTTHRPSSRTTASIFVGCPDCEMSEGTNGRFLTHIQ